MQLTLRDRLIILNILPTEGNFITMTAKHDLIEKIKVTQDEIVSLKIESTPEGGIKWDGTKDEEKEFEITELELKLVKEKLKKLDEEGKLNDDILIIYKKINVQM